MPNARKIAVVALLFVALAGCQATQLQRAESIEHAFTAAMTGVNAAIDAGLVKTPAQAKAVRIAVTEANAAVADHTRAATANEANADYYKTRAVEAVARLTTIGLTLREGK